MANFRNETRRKQITELYEQGLTRWAMAQKLGIQLSVVNYYLKILNLRKNVSTK